MEHIPVLVLKINKDSLPKVSVADRRWMHASGVIASLVLPLLILPNSYSLGPLWVGLLFILLVVSNTLFILYFSPKSGDLFRAKMAE